jgi:hypothetical protein
MTVEELKEFEIAEVTIKVMARAPKETKDRLSKVLTTSLESFLKGEDTSPSIEAIRLLVKNGAVAIKVEKL